MDSPSLIPRIESSPYQWRASTKTSKLYLRRALGAEGKWAHQASRTRQMFLSGKFTLTGPYSALSVEVFRKAAECAWLRVRGEFPEVVLGPSSEQGDDGSILVQLKIPGSVEEVIEWMRRSLFFGVYEKCRSAEEEMRKAAIEEPVSVRLNVISDPESKVSGAEFAFRLDHLTADGVGAYIVTACFLNFLVNAMGGRDETLNWESLKGKLPTPWLGMMNTAQRTEGHEFEEGVKKLTNLEMEASVGNFPTVERVFGLTFWAQKSKWGMKVLSQDDYSPKAIHKRFSVEKSNAILGTVKKELGKTGSVTHLGHAAMVMTMLKFKPVQERPTNATRILSPLFINGRRYLDQNFPGSQNYISLCRAFSTIEFRDVDGYILSDNASKEEVQAKLRLACAEAFRSYQAVQDQKSLLTESISMAEYRAKAKYIQPTFDRAILY